MTGQGWVLGVDPGRTVGICALDLAGTRLVGDPWLIQCTPEAAEWIIATLVAGGSVERLAVERYVSGPRSVRARDRGAQDLTRALVDRLTALAAGAGVVLAARSAGQVKPWATDARLSAAGITAPAGTGYRHALDAARAALFCAVADLGVPDPLSRGTPR